jgi:hypothetical protein
MSEEQLQEAVAYLESRYDQNIRFVDAQLERLLSSLDEQDVVVLFSDHGEEFGEHGELEHGHAVHEELLRIPLVIRAPGIEPGRIRSPVSLLDIAPTVLELANVQTDAVQGESLLALMRGESNASSATERAHVAGRTLYGSDAWAVLSAGRKWVLRNGVERIYDLDSDPGEGRPLSVVEEDNQEARAQLTEQLDVTMRQAWRLSGDGVSKQLTLQKATLEIVHPDGFSQTWKAWDARKRTADPVLTTGGMRIDALEQPAPLETFVLPAPGADPALAELIVEHRGRQYRAKSSSEPEGSTLLTLEVAGHSLQVTRSWVPLPGQGQIDLDLDAGASEQLELLGYLER